MTAMAGYKGQIIITSSPSVVANNISLTDAGDHKTYNISTSATQKYWDQTQTSSFVVQISTDGGSTWGAAPAYTITKYVNGQITFTVAQSVGTLARMQTVYYFAYSALGDCKEWQLSLDKTITDVTTFSTTGWKSELATLTGASVKISKFWVDDTFFLDLGNLMVLSLYTDQTTLNRYEGYAYLKQDSIKDAVNSVIEEDISFEVTGQMYFMTT